MARNKLLQPRPAEKDPRCTGRTTALALGALHRAMDSPGVTVYASDHHEPSTRAAQQRILDAINLCIARLEFQHIVVEPVIVGNRYEGHVRVRFDLWAEV